LNSIFLETVLTSPFLHIVLFSAAAGIMRLYSTSKTPSPINSDWIQWTKTNFKNIDADSISALLFITRNKEIEIIYKPTPIINDANGKLEGIMGNMFDDGSTPAIIKIDSGDIGSCTTIKVFDEVPEKFRPEFALLADSVKDTYWETTKKELALIVIPTLAPLPYGTDIKSTELDDHDFVEEMKKLSPEHEFWASMMVHAHDQYESDWDNSDVVKNLSTTTSSTRRDPCNAASKGFREATFALSGPVVFATRPRNKHEREQQIIKEFFYRNPTPARPIPIEEDEDDGNDAPEIQVQSTTAPNPSAAAAINPAAANSSAEFYSQLLETLKTINQATPNQQKIVVESHEHEESVDLAKLQN